MSFFLAVDPPDGVRAQVAALIERVRQTHVAKWQRPEKLHVTLVFLGAPSVEARAALEAPVARWAQAQRPFRLTLQGAGTFATARAPTVLWLGLGGDTEVLGAAQRALSDVAQAPGEGRPYVPHLTLARAQVVGVLEPLAAELKDFTTEPFEVNRVTLYESTHQQYRAVFSCRFGPSAQ